MKMEIKNAVKMQEGKKNEKSLENERELREENV